MKPIERGAVVLVIGENDPQSGVVSGRNEIVTQCETCDRVGEYWELHEDPKYCYCVCRLIRIDDDPDAVTEPSEQEETA